MYDYLVVGAGLFGAVFAQQAKAAGKSVLVVDRRDHIAGNVYTQELENIHVHVYGAHIFHTNSERVWNYVNRYACFNSYVHMPLANYKGKLYNLPFNMHTFTQMWGDVTPEEAAGIIARQASSVQEPSNLEEQAISLVGTVLYFVKNIVYAIMGKAKGERRPEKQLHHERILMFSEGRSYYYTFKPVIDAFLRRGVPFSYIYSGLPCLAIGVWSTRNLPPQITTLLLYFNYSIFIHLCLVFCQTISLFLKY